MTTFDDRQRAFEDKFKHDQDLQFRVVNRRNKLMGLWAASQLGKAGADADAYAKEVVLSDFEKPGDDDILDKVLKDFQAAGIEMSTHRLRKHLEELTAAAKEQVMKE
jgi:hypothetical protein